MDRPNSPSIDIFAEEQYVDVDGINTRYIDIGSGPPIVLIHGGHFGMWIPGGLENWETNVLALSQRHRVVAFDKLGQGQTDLPKSESDWTFEAVSLHAKSFIEKLDLTDIVFVGHSRGGLLASWLALELPERLAGLCIVSSATLGTAGTDIKDMDFYDRVAAGTPQDASAAEVITHYLRAQFVQPDIPPEHVESAAILYRTDKHQEAMRTLERVNDSHWTPSLTKAKKSVVERLADGGLGDSPLTMIWGKDDRSAPLELGLELFGALLRPFDVANLHVLDGAGHYVFVERAEAFNELIDYYRTRWTGV